MSVVTVDFDGQENPTQQTSLTTGLTIFPIATSNYPAAVYLAKAKFNWFSLSDQLGISVGTDGASDTQIGVVSFDSSLNGKTGSIYTASNTCHFGLATGRFDSMQTNPLRRLRRYLIQISSWPTLRRTAPPEATPPRSMIVDPNTLP